jgi:hypothetical protein
MSLLIQNQDRDRDRSQSTLNSNSIFQKYFFESRYDAIFEDDVCSNEKSKIILNLVKSNPPRKSFGMEYILKIMERGCKITPLIEKILAHPKFIFEKKINSLPTLLYLVNLRQFTPEFFTILQILLSTNKLDTKVVDSHKNNALMIVCDLPENPLSTHFTRLLMEPTKIVLKQKNSTADETALVIAYKRQNYAIFKTLIENTDLSLITELLFEPNDNGERIISLISKEQGSAPLFEYILSYYEKKDEMELFELMEQIIKTKIDIRGNNMEMLALYNKNEAISELVWKYREIVVVDLIKSLHQKNYQDQTTLIIACMMGSLAYIKTAFMSLQNQNQNYEFEELLFEKDIRNMDAIMYAVKGQHTHILDFLFDHIIMEHPINLYEIAEAAISSNNAQFVCFVFAKIIDKFDDYMFVNQIFLKKVVDTQNLAIINRILPYYNDKPEIIEAILSMENNPDVRFLLEKYKNKTLSYDYITTNIQTVIKECDLMEISDIISIFNKLGISIFDEKDCRLLSRSELCDKLKQYYMYIEFNKNIGSDPKSIYPIQQSIVRSNILDKKNDNTFSKTFVFTYNSLPLIFRIVYYGVFSAFSFSSSVDFQNSNFSDIIDDSMLDITGRVDSQNIFIDLFWTNPKKLEVMKEFKNKQNAIKGLGKYCLCLLFNYFLKVGFLSLEKKVKLDASGPKCSSSALADLNINEVFNFIGRYSPALLNHINERYQRNLVVFSEELRNSAPYEYQYSNKDIKTYLCLVSDNMKLMRYYSGYGLQIDEEYYKTINFDPLAVRLHSTVAKVIQACQ